MVALGPARQVPQMIRVLPSPNGKRKLIISYMRLIFYKNLYAFYVVSLHFTHTTARPAQEKRNEDILTGTNLNSACREKVQIAAAINFEQILIIKETKLLSSVHATWSSSSFFGGCCLLSFRDPPRPSSRDQH